MNLKNLFRIHKDKNYGEAKAGKTTSYQSSYTSYTYTSKPDCDKHHVLPIKLGPGELYGFPGKMHDKEQEHMDVNIWLASYRIPQDVFYRNLPVTVEPISGAKCGDIIFPIEDRKVPDTNKMRWVTDVIRRCLEGGMKVGVSCQGGHGRTGLVVSCVYGLFHPEVLDPVSMVRTHLCDSMVENCEQEVFVLKFLGLETPKRVTDAIAAEKAEKEKWKNYDYSKVYGHNGGYYSSGYGDSGGVITAGSKTIRAGDPDRARAWDDRTGGCPPF